MSPSVRDPDPRRGCAENLPASQIVQPIYRRIYIAGSTARQRPNHRAERAGPIRRGLTPRRRSPKMLKRPRRGRRSPPPRASREPSETDQGENPTRYCRGDRSELFRARNGTTGIARIPDLPEAALVGAISAQLRRPGSRSAMSASRRSAPFDRTRPTSAKGQAEERAGLFPSRPRP
jgi:hypothetical protein